MYLPRHTYTYRHTHTHIEVRLYVQLCGNLFFKDITVTSFGEGEHDFSIIPNNIIYHFKIHVTYGMSYFLRCSCSFRKSSVLLLFTPEVFL